MKLFQQENSRVPSRFLSRQLLDVSHGGPGPRPDAAWGVLTAMQRVR